MKWRVRRAGREGLLLERGELSAELLQECAETIRAAERVNACIVGEQSLYVIGSELDEVRILSLLDHQSERSFAGTREHVIPVSFAPADAPDLESFLAAHALSRQEFLQQLQQLTLHVRYLGFRAGFGYIEGWPAAWSLPRLPTSRPVQAGSLGLAGHRLGFYPLDSPGGWNILGRTSERFWTATEQPPNRLAPGDRVVLQPVEFLGPGQARETEYGCAGEPVAEVVRAGQLTLLVAGGDPGRLAAGLSAGGPFDARAAALANRAAGSDPHAAVLECLYVGPSLRFIDDGVVSWYGARTEPLLDGLVISDPRRILVRRGQTLTIGRLWDGLRGWLAVSGGFEALAPGTLEQPTRVQSEMMLRRGISSQASRVNPEAIRDDARRLKVGSGPHDEIVLGRVVCEVTTQLDRVGIRLRPLQPLPGTPPSDLPSSGMQFGTVQWHPDGSLVVMGPDHPITGGYCQPFTLDASERWKLAQLAPGDRVVLEPYSP